MRLPSIDRRLVPLLVFALSACAAPQDSLASLAVRDASLAIDVHGGWSAYRYTTYVDSASARWERVRCELGQSSSPCRSSDVVRSGVVTRDRLIALFATLRSPGFRAVPPDVPGGGGPEVDGTLYTLLYTGESGPRTVQWRTAAQLPSPLTTFIAALDSATGGGWR